MRYPRNPSLDPQLVWKGKDEQDSHDLEVPAVPIYIQETIDPLALVEELRAESQGRQLEEQLGFFAPYTDLTFEEKVEFYRHPGKWSNRMILGDSLLVMTSSPTSVPCPWTRYPRNTIWECQSSISPDGCGYGA